MKYDGTLALCVYLSINQSIYPSIYLPFCLFTCGISWISTFHLSLSSTMYRMNLHHCHKLFVIPIMSVAVRRNYFFFLLFERNILLTCPLMLQNKPLQHYNFRIYRISLSRRVTQGRERGEVSQWQEIQVYVALSEGLKSLR